MSNKKRTAITAHRITKQVSLFNLNYALLGDNKTWHTGAIFRYTDGTSGDISVTTSGKLSVHHAKGFDYIMSIANAQSKDGKLPQKVKFNLGDLAEEIGKKNTWQERERMMYLIQDLHNFTIYMVKGSKKWMFHVISGVKADTKTGEIAVGFGIDYEELFNFTKKRYVEISETLKLKGDSKAYEFAKFLQANGQGAGKPVSEFTYKQAVNYMGYAEVDYTKEGELKSLRESNSRKITAMLTTLHKETSYPKYKRTKLKDSYIWRKMHLKPSYK